MVELICFPGKDRTINVPQEISTTYDTFGIALLEDRTGARIKAIALQYMNDATKVNMEVLQQWIGGTGRRPVTWATLVEVLRDTGLNALAQDLEAVRGCPET